ncbi:Uncharacterised protein [uncultured Ruminococcus sp.]|nr:Uncharacterised protein [uncultured Ruminococcus sp.]
MERQAVHVGAGNFHQLLRPVIIVRIWAAGYAEYSIIAVVAHIGLVTAVFVSIILGAHTAAAAPVFITHAEVVNAPGLWVAVLGAQLGHGGDAVKGHVFHPLAHFLNGSTAEVPIYIGLAAKLPAELHKFMGAEAVVLYQASPVGIDHFLSAFTRANAVLPVVFIGKAAARPA